MFAAKYRNALALSVAGLLQVHLWSCIYRYSVDFKEKK